MRLFDRLPKFSVIRWQRIYRRMLKGVLQKILLIILSKRKKVVSRVGAAAQLKAMKQVRGSSKAETGFPHLTQIVRRGCIPFLFLGTLVLFFYLLCLKLDSMDLFHYLIYLISKKGLSLGSLVLLSRGLGCEGWLLLVLILAAFGIFDGTILNMTGGNETVNQGPHRGDAGPSSIQNDESDS